LIEVIQNDIVYKGRVLKVGASIGVHYSANLTENLDQWLKAADTAMYQAKSSGKGRYVINQG
jgi:diguanylate cyclase (GGDEF)-like protein